MELTGTVGLVTGASSGIGEATALTLAAQGASVVLAARRADRIADLQQRIEQAGGTATTVTCDVTEEADAAKAVAAAVDAYGRLDTVVANAGVMLLGPISDAPTEEWRRMIHTNVLGLMYTVHAALPELRKAAAGDPRRVADVVLVSSVAGRVARLGSGVYNASKHAVGAFAESLRQEVTADHVRVGLIEPGAVTTELADHMRADVRAQAMKRFAEIERLEADDIARAVAYLVTQPRHVAVNELLIRPTEQQG